MVSTKEIVWMAGLLEGEGCFLLRKPRGGGAASPCPCIVLSMTDLDIVQRVAKLLGVKINRYPDLRKSHYKPQWRCQVSGMRATGWMMTFYQFMGDRRRTRILEILDEWRKVNPKARAPKGIHRNATCHPDRPFVSNGLCHTCYMRQYRMQGPMREKELLPWQRKRITVLDLKGE